MIGMKSSGNEAVGEYVPTNEYVSVNEYVPTEEYVSMDGLHEIHAIHGIDEELGAIEAGADVGVGNGIFANNW